MQILKYLQVQHTKDWSAGTVIVREQVLHSSAARFARPNRRSCSQAKGRSFAALSAAQSKWRARLQANYFLVAFESDLREDFIDEDCLQSVRHFWKVCRVRVGTKKRF